jgi:membrane associated rhomboid family serine protease
MSYTVSYGWGPNTTPKALQYLIGTIAIISILSAFIDGFFVYFLNMSGPQALLSLSWNGLRQWYIWQPLSYLFVLSSGNAGLSFLFFLQLLFDLYILWIMGSTLIERIGTGRFLRFFYISGILTGLLTLLSMPSLNQYMELAGPTAPIIGMMAIWTFLHPESELLFFFLIPMKAKWFFAGFFGITFLIQLSQFNLIGALFQTISLITGYLYATTIWELSTPFTFTQLADRFFIRLGIKCRGLLNRTRAHQTPIADTSSKIFDFHTGTPMLDDDAFMDQILDKISQKGEKSLTWSERSRMRKISNKKSRRR